MQKPQFDLARVASVLSVGVAAVVGIGLFLALGLFLDHHLGTTPLFTLIGLMVGGAGVFYNVYRLVLSALDGRDAQEQRRSKGSKRSRKTGRAR